MGAEQDNVIDPGCRVPGYNTELCGRPHVTGSNTMDGVGSGSGESTSVNLGLGTIVVTRPCRSALSEGS